MGSFSFFDPANVHSRNISFNLKKGSDLKLQEQEATKAIESLWDSGVLRLIGAAVVVFFFMFKTEIKNAIFSRAKGKNGVGNTALSSSARMAFQVGEMHKKIEEIAPKITNLEEWHDVDHPGQPGVKIWWHSKELSEDIKRLTKAIERLNDS